MRLTHALALAASLTTTAALAQDQPDVDRHFMRTGKWYGAVSAGVTFPNDGEISTGLEFFGNPSNSIEYDAGYNFNGSIGRYFEWFRLEGELSIRQNDVDAWEISGFGDVDGEGDLNTVAIMGNAYYDIQVTQRTDIYLGGGVGAARVDAEIRSGTVERSGGEWIFAWQLMAGLSYQLRDNLALTGGYRLFAADNCDLDDADFKTPIVHSFEIGLRYTF